MLEQKQQQLHQNMYYVVKKQREIENNWEIILQENLKLLIHSRLFQKATPAIDRFPLKRFQSALSLFIYLFINLMAK